MHASKISALYNYYHTRALKGNENKMIGISFTSATKIFKQHGTCKYDLMPDDPKNDEDFLKKPSKEADEDAHK